jgi:hypothetical protein
MSTDLGRVVECSHHPKADIRLRQYVGTLFGVITTRYHQQHPVSERWTIRDWLPQNPITLT